MCVICCVNIYFMLMLWLKIAPVPSMKLFPARLQFQHSSSSCCDVLSHYLLHISLFTLQCQKLCCLCSLCALFMCFDFLGSNILHCQKLTM
uniref:Putative secreted protein n=1 Tax=Amblyomma triste TaxID=251400 RepID=A0A023G3S5_AMBTT